MAAVQYTYRPDTDIMTEWVPSASGDHYALVDDATPSFDDSIQATCNNKGDKDSFNAADSAESYADAPCIPWNYMKVSVYAKKINPSGAGTHEIKLFLKVNGTYYYSSIIAISSGSGAYYEYSWTSAPWDTTGKINWGYAPNEIEFGVEIYTEAPPIFPPYKGVEIASIFLECEYPDHTPETPPAPTNPLITTYNSEIQGFDGELNPTNLVTWRPKVSCISTMTGNDCCGVRIRIGTTDGGNDVFEGNFYFYSYVDYLARTPKDSAQYSGGSGSGVLQDGITYYWDIALLNEYADAGSWCDAGTFPGVTDFGWWSNDWNRRFNLRAGTNHDALGVGYTRKVDINTGHGVTLSTTAKMNEAIQHSSRHLAYYSGFWYAVWLDTPTVTSTMRVYISKSDDPDDPDSWDTPVEVHNTGIYTDTHRYPSVIVTNEERLLVIIGGHDGQSLIRRSTYTHVSGTGIDITSWITASAPIALGNSTYCRPVMTSNGNIYIFFRHLETHRGHLCYTKSTDDGASWSYRKYVVYYHDYVESPPSIYCGGCVVDENDRLHIIVSWWDAYFGDNKGRAVSYMYSDLSSGEFTDWYELESGTKIGEATDSRDSDKNVDYAAASKIDTCTDPDTTLSGDFVHTNSEALAVDSSNNPIIIYYYYAAVGDQNDETSIYVATWGGSSWDIVDLYAHESLAKLWKYRQGGQLYYQSGAVYIYGFVKPTGEIRFGGELYVWRWNISTDSWNGYYLAKNTGVGIGMLSVLQNPVDGKRALIFVRGEDIVFMFDEPTIAVRYDGDDVRIVEVDYNEGTQTYTEMDRLPDAFQMVHTGLYFSLNTAIAANVNAPTDKIYQVYIGKHDATNPPRDYTEVFRYLENFEGYADNSYLDGQGGWSVSGSAFMKIYSSDGIWTGAHTNKLWDGDKFLRVNGASVATKDLNDTYPGLGTDITNKEILFHFWKEEDGTAEAYVELYDDTAAKYIRLGFNMYTDDAGYKTTSGSWTDVVNVNETRYYTFKLTINSSGVSGYVNDQTVFSGNTEITVFDKIKIGMTGSADGVFDQILIIDWVSNGPEETDTEDNPDIKDLVGTARLAQKLVPTLIGGSRQAHTMSLVKVGVQRLAEILQLQNVDGARLAEILNTVVTRHTRQAQDIVAEITTKARQSQRLTPEAELSARLAAAIVANALASDRFAQRVVAEIIQSGLLANLTIPEHTIAQRCAEILILQAIGESRIAQAAKGDKQASDDIANIAIILGIDKFRIANIFGAEATGAGRQAQIAVLLKEEITRQCHAAIVEAVNEATIAGTLDMNKMAGGRLSAFLKGDKRIGERIASIVKFQAAISERLAQYLGVDKITAERIGQLLQIEAENHDRIGQYLQGDKQALGKIMSALMPLGQGSERIANIVAMESGISERQAQIMVALKQELVRISQKIIAESRNADRMAQILLSDKTVADRAAALLAPDKIARIRLAQTLHFEGIQYQYERLANFMQVEMEEASELAQAVLAEKPSHSRIANIILSQAATFGRLASSLIVETSEIKRMAQITLAEKTSIDNVAQILLTDKIVLDRLAQCVMAEMTASARLGNWLVPTVARSRRDMSLLLVEASGRPRLAQLVIFYGRTLARFGQSLILKQGYLSLPDGRSVEIAEEFRELAIAAEDRSILITEEDRRIEVEQ